MLTKLFFFLVTSFIVNDERGTLIIFIYRLDLYFSFFLTLTMKVGLLYVPECSLCHKGTLLLFESRKNPDSIFINLIETAGEGSGALQAEVD